MANPSKARGSKWERDICTYLNGVLEYSHPADWRLIKRQVQYGAKDVGDIHAYPLVIEAKDVASPSVPTWLRQADAEAANAGFPYGVVAHKVRGKGPALARVHITDETWTNVLDDLEYEPDGLPIPSFTRGYWTWTLAEFAEVLRAVRAQMPPPN